MAVRRVDQIRRPAASALWEADSEEELAPTPFRAAVGRSPEEGDWARVGKNMFIYMDTKWHLVSNRTARE